MPSATAAYRKDLQAHTRPFGDHDAEWIAVASLLEHATGATPDDRRHLVGEAARVAAEALGPDELTRLARREWGAEPSAVIDPITLLAVIETEVGAKALAGTTLDHALQCMDGVFELPAGRLLAQRARVAYLSSELDAAQEWYDAVLKLGLQLDSAELQTRAALGEVSLLHMRGNHPKYQQRAREAVTLARRAGIPRYVGQAHYAVMMAGAFFKQFDEALEHGWEFLRLAGSSSSERAFALQSVGQLLFDMGDIRSARTAFAAVVGLDARPHIHLAALGGLAMSAATSGDAATMEWAIAEILRLRDSVAPRYAVTMALVEAAIALRDIGRVDDAARMRDEALSLAVAHRFNELSHRAETLELTPMPAPPSPAITHSGLVESLRGLEPVRLPRHVAVAAGV
jgi:tetratricopeptide (TPR) repeat protein